MDYNEQREFEIICTTAQLFIRSYNQHPFIPDWLFLRFHHRGKQVAHFETTIQTLKTAITPRDTLKEATDRLIKLLTNEYYLLYVKTVSRRLRDKLLDALFAVLNFSSNDVPVYQTLVLQASDPATYLQHFNKNQELQNYKNYFASKHAIYGIPAKELGDNELTLIAKEGLVNGELVARFGVKKTIEQGLARVKHELQALINQNVAKGFLSLESARGYIHKIELLQTECRADNMDEITLVQNARYLLETIINTAGILPLGPAKYPEHAVLITCCYWVDEFLQQAKAGFEVA